MNDYLPLVRHLLDSPADDVARLVFADWLEEQNQSLRAEFIRVCVAWESSEDSAERSLLGTQRDQLKQQHWDEISGGLPHNRPGRYRFHLGLPDRVDLTGAEAVAYGEAIYSVYPIPRVCLRRFYFQSHEIARCLWLKQVQEIHLARDDQLRTPGIARLLRSPHWTNLRRLDLRNLGEAGILCEALAQQTRMQRLRYLNLSGSGVHVFAMRSLCESMALAQVEVLDLSTNPITDSAALALTRCRHFHRLRILNLARPDHLSKTMRKRLRRHFGDALQLEEPRPHSRCP